MLSNAQIGSSGLWLNISVAIGSLFLGSVLTLYIAHFLYRCRQVDVRMSMIRNSFSELISSVYEVHQQYMIAVVNRYDATGEKTRRQHWLPYLIATSTAIAKLKLCRVQLDTSGWEECMNDLDIKFRAFHGVIADSIQAEVPLSNELADEANLKWVDTASSIMRATKYLHSIDGWDPSDSKLSFPSV